MREILRSASLTAALVLLGAVSTCVPAQTPAGVHPSRPDGVRAVREIDDVPLGVAWLLVRDPVHPGGPGRLVRAGEALDPALGSTAAPLAPMRPVIRAGDRVIVEEDSAVAVVRLEATALSAAVAGAEFEARLKVAGTSVRAWALGPGRASLDPPAPAQIEVRP